MDEERRKFLLMAVSSLVVASSTSATHAIAAEAAAPESVALDRFLAEFLVALPDARAMGRRYLEVSPDQKAKAQELAARIRAAHGRLPVELVQQVVEGRQADLDTDNMLVLDGWVLAWHEAWLCAAASLV